MKNKQTNHRYYHYFKKNFSLYIFAFVLFVMGIIFGSFIIFSLSINQKQELINYLSSFFHEILTNSQMNNSSYLFKQITIENIKYLGILWFLGLSVIGMPLIFVFVFMKGFAIGFTISFLIAELGWKGFLFAMVSIIPQNLIIVPVLIIASVSGIGFSLNLIRARSKKKMNIAFPSIISYSFVILLLSLVIVLASGFESYVSPHLMKSVSTLFIQ